MTRKWIYLAALGPLLCLLALSRTWAEDAASAPPADDGKTVGDDFRPMGPPPRAERGPRGTQNLDPLNPLSPNRPGGPPREGTGGPDAFRRPGPPEGPRGAESRGGPGRHPGPEGSPGLPFVPRGGLAAMEQDDPEMFKLMQADYNLERQSQQLADQCRRAPEDEQEVIKQKLERTVTEHFEARQQRRGLELKRLEEELKRLRELIEKRNQSQQQIVKRRVSELLGVQDELKF